MGTVQETKGADPTRQEEVQEAPLAVVQDPEASSLLSSLNLPMDS